MPYTVEIAHPDDAVKNQWKFIAVVDTKNEVHDLVESPTFEYERGLCIRARDNTEIIYTGIYGDDDCYDIGPDSIFMGTLTWAFDAGSRVDTQSKNFIDAWVESNNPQAMIRSISKIIPRRELVKIAFAISETVASTIPSTFYNVYLLKDLIVAWMGGTTMPPSSNKLYDKVLRFAETLPPGLDERVSALVHVYRVITDKIERIDYAAAAVVNAVSVVRARTRYRNYDIRRVPLMREDERKIAAQLRQIVPFHLIATNVPNHQLRYFGE